MLRSALAHERDTPEGAARDRKRKLIFYTFLTAVIIGGAVYQLLTQ
ncbi:hypothetical protein GCM10010405_61080 [Streptomyces macrosporus]|uniref:Uncharacterized protein n=2 Tax=Streptomyces macrosporus TaxID=44032 RepID=A0ABN3KNU0_9ACTN